MNRTTAEAELRRLVTERWSSLVRFGLLLTGDVGAAEDLVQSALEKCWPRWSTIQDAGRERYLRATMANLSASRWRRRRFREVTLDTSGSVSTGPVLASSPGPDDPVAQRDELWRLLLALPPRMRAVVVLRYLEDLSEAETARVLGCSVGTVKSQSSRGLNQLRAALNDMTDDEKVRR